jgi:hypothetical protein
MGPMVIVDAHEYTKTPTWECDGSLDYAEYFDEEQDELDEELFVVHDVHLSVALLRTCRQIYAEAASILYGKNIFKFSVSAHRHNGNFRQMRTCMQ